MSISTQRLMDLMFELKHCCQMQEEQIRKEAKLSPAEYACVIEMPFESALETGVLAKKMGLSPSRGGRVIDGLVKRGIIARSPAESDRRVSLLELSNAGRSIKVRIENMLGECEKTLRATLDADEQLKVLDGLKILVRAITSKERLGI